MKTGRSLQELAAEVDRQSRSKKDYLADSRAVQMDTDLTLRGVNGGMPLRPTAHAQLAATLGIPKAYYDRMQEEAPELLAHNVNRWLHTRPQRKLVRTLDGSIRAILSDSYRPLDNYDLMEAVLPKISELACRVVSCEVTENRFYLKAITDKVTGEVKPGDRVQAGLVVSNSEVGQGSLRVEALDYRLVCANGMVRESAIRKTHLGRNGGRGHDAIEDAREFFRDETRLADDRAFFLKVQDAVGAMFDPKRFESRLLQYRDAGERPITADPVAVVEQVADRYALVQEERSSVLRHLIQGGDLSEWGLANAITRTAEDAKDYDRASELESFGGKVIELSPSEWRQLAEVK